MEEPAKMVLKNVSKLLNIDYDLCSVPPLDLTQFNLPDELMDPVETISSGILQSHCVHWYLCSDMHIFIATPTVLACCTKQNMMPGLM